MRGATSLKDSFQYEVKHAEQENNDRDLVDAVHHFEVDVGGT